MNLPKWWPSDKPYIIGDCLEGMKQLPDKCVDLVLTDPPYGIDGSSGTINKKRDKGNYGQTFPDNKEYVYGFVQEVFKECVRASNAIILTPGNPNMMAYPQPDSFGCIYQPASVGIQTFGNADGQPILYYGKNPTKKNLGKRCSFQVTKADCDINHPCPKPLSLWEDIVINHSLPGQIILDPFLGSGTTLLAARKTNRMGLGFEINPDYEPIIRKRSLQDIKPLESYFIEGE